MTDLCPVLIIVKAVLGTCDHITAVLLVAVSDTAWLAYSSTPGFCLQCVSILVLI